MTALDTIRRQLQTSQTILCVSHIGPDGDAVGSLLGMGHILRQLGKCTTLALQDPVPEEFHFMPGADEVVAADQIKPQYDLIVCLDASSPDRMGNIYHTELKSIPLVVIDHHVTNTFFGDTNWVAPEYAATCQMLVHLAEGLNVPLSTPLATYLLTGLVTDTLCFRTSNTDALVLGAAMQLMQAGANLSDITARTLNRRRYSTVKLWGHVLPYVKLEDHVIWLTISRQQMAVAGATNGELQLSSFLVATAEADISATFLEKQDDAGCPVVECSFRAKPGFDVSSVAYDLGGGGHPPASGCTLPGTLDDAVTQVIPLLKNARQVGATNPSESSL